MATAGSAPERVYGGVPAGERRALRRARLLKAGLELLGDEGWEATTVTAVCERARLTPRYFYESFQSRDELVVAIFDAIVEEVAAEVRDDFEAGSPDIEDFIRASIAAWVNVASDDPRKGRVAFVEALGSETLMRRRLDATRRFAGIVSEQARAAYDVRGRDAGVLDAAGLVVAGGLIETMIDWLEGGLAQPAEQLIEDFTAVCMGSLKAAMARGRGPGRSRPRGS
jgi:AcrR family transcriptional regulator